MSAKADPKCHRFEDKVVLITGAAAGIGEAAAQRFAAEGARLALCDISESRLNEVVAALSIDADRVISARVDVSDFETLEAFVEKTAEHFGQLDVLVNNAGMSCFGHADEISLEQWRKVMTIDLDAVFVGSRAALPHLRKSKGNIVNTASISGLFADPGLMAYNTAKAGVVNLTRNMAVDHAGENIRVNCVCPGGVASLMFTPHLQEPTIMAEYADLIPMSRVAEPHEIAASIAFLASDDASYITGEALVIDGGVTAQTGQPNFDKMYRSRGWDKAILAGKAPN